MSEYLKCSHGHIIKNGGEHDGVYFFHFQRHPIYKIRSLILILATTILAALLIWHVSILLKSTHVYLVLNLIAVIFVAIAVIGVFDEDDIIKLGIYYLKPDAVKRIKYNKHWFFPGYLVKLPEIEISIKSVYKNEDYGVSTIILGKHNLSCVMNVGIIKNTLSNIEPNSQSCKLIYNNDL